MPLPSQPQLVLIYRPRRDGRLSRPRCEIAPAEIRTPCAGSGVVRIDPLRFLAGFRTRRLNQALSVLSLSLGFF